MRTKKRPVKRMVLAFTFGFALLCNSVLAQGPPLDRVVVFGDSLCDTGNLYQVTQGGFPFEGPAPIFPIAFYPQGRFTNGPVWVETFAPVAGFATPANFTTTLGGTNFAFGGAETGIGSSQRDSPNVGTQVGLFQASQGSFTGTELIILWAGANDFNPVPPASLPSPESVVANMVSRITELNQLGGKYFLVPNVPPLGDTPQGRAQGPLVSFVLNLVVFQYNQLLDDALDGLEKNLDISVVRFDTFGLVSKVGSSPSAFGFANVTEPAFDLATLTTVPNPNEYLYWDTLHPTAAAHAVLGKAAVNAFLNRSMKLAFDSDQSWGIDVNGWFGKWNEATLVFRLNVAKFYLDIGEIPASINQLQRFRAKVQSLASQGRLSNGDATWLIQQSTTAITCLGGN